MVEHGQLRALGVSASLIDHARRRGRLHPVHHGVSSLVVPAARPRLAPEHAALLACGPRAVISHHSAAWLHGLGLQRPEVAEVTVVGGDRGRSRPGVRAHRSRVMHRGEVVRIERLAVTSVARTVVDLLPDLSDRLLERVVDLALQKTSRAKLRQAVVRHTRRSGIGRLAALLDPTRPSSDTWSEPEEQLLLRIRRADLPSPEANVWIGPYRPDLVWRDHRVIVEYDSDRFHSGTRARYRDARRHNDLTSWGWDVIHVTRQDLSHHPERILVWIAAALTRAEVAGHGHPGR